MITFFSFPYQLLVGFLHLTAATRSHPSRRNVFLLIHTSRLDSHMNNTGGGGDSHGILANVLDYDIVVSEFELQSRYSPVGWDYKIRRQHLCRRLRPPSPTSVLDIYGEVSVLELWGMGNTLLIVIKVFFSFLLLFPQRLRPSSGVCRTREPSWNF